MRSDTFRMTSALGGGEPEKAGPHKAYERRGGCVILMVTNEGVKESIFFANVM